MMPRKPIEKPMGEQLKTNVAETPVAAGGVGQGRSRKYEVRSTKYEVRSTKWGRSRDRPF